MTILLSLFSGLAAKLIAGVALVAGLIAVYFGIKAKGANQAREEIRQELQQEKDKVQARVDDAREQDAKIDAKVAQKVEALKPKPQPPAPPVKPGDKFKFMWVLLLLPFLAGCVTVPAVAPVRVEVPSAPVLADCQAVPHPEGVVIQQPDGSLGVVLSLADAQWIQVYLAEAPQCWAAREAVLQGYIEKLINRLRAVGGSQ